jgi:catechol 2,3-dioxygenase-like lactoylglutathione lyase family enzyme
MTSRLFDHIDLRVSNLARARRFYDVFLPAVGFTEIKPDGAAMSYRAPGEGAPARFVEINEEPNHRGNANRIAFWGESEEAVNRLGEIARGAGARMMEGPEYCQEYTPGYYAVFFEDDDGNKWEVCCRNARVR